MPTQQNLRELTPAEVHAAMQRNAIVLIDVREPAEYATDRINGALLCPLSTFDPSSLPVGPRAIVLHCGSGKRSATAVAKCIAADIAVTTHMAGGIAAWKQAGLPTVAASADGGPTAAPR